LYQAVQYWNLGLQDGAVSHWDEVLKAFVNIQLVRIELVISVDQEHGTRIDHIVAAPPTHPVTQAGHTAMPAIVEKRINITVNVIVCK
jgi:hypothetical protein